jgi:hypothetical protein
VARYADRLLADGERVALRGRQHVLATIIEGRVAWSILVASLVIVILDAFYLSATDDSGRLVRDVFGWIGLALLVIALAWLVKIYVEWYAEDYLITNRRVMKVEGVLKKRSADSSLEKINDAVLKQGILGRLLHFGDLDILTASENTVDQFRMLNDAANFKKTMLNAKYALEREVSAPMPSPPLRVPTGGTIADPGATAIGADVGDPAMTPAEVTDTLRRLADLRDRGAISSAEYEAKKADLLGRI